MSEILTLPVFSQYMERPMPPGGRDDLVRQSINEFITNYCGRNFDAASYVDKITIVDHYRKKFFVTNPPIRAVTSIQVGRPPTSTWATDQYFIEDANIGLVCTIGSYLLIGPEMYTITYDGGMLVIPLDLKLMACSIAAREAEKAAKGRHGLGQRQVGFGGNELFVRDLEVTEQRVLDSYRMSLWP